MRVDSRVPAVKVGRGDGEPRGDGTALVSADHVVPQVTSPADAALGRSGRRRARDGWLGRGRRGGRPSDADADVGVERETRACCESGTRLVKMFIMGGSGLETYCCRRLGSSCRTGSA